MTVEHIAATAPLIGLGSEVTINSVKIPYPRFKTLYIAHNPSHAEQLQRQFADPAYMAEREIVSIDAGSPHYRVVYPGKVLAGIRCANIVIQSRVLEALKRDPKAWDWYQEIALCRLVPGGVVQVID